tara:strand:+ start:274 stop:390 length:117 start_codon:yes stop_codon:yes gene_type:complete
MGSSPIEGIDMNKVIIAFLVMIGIFVMILQIWFAEESE